MFLFAAAVLFVFVVVVNSRCCNAEMLAKRTLEKSTLFVYNSALQTGVACCDAEIAYFLITCCCIDGMTKRT